MSGGKRGPMQALVVNGHEPADQPEEQALDSIVADLKERIVMLESQAHNQHSIAPEVIESIMQQVAKRAVLEVVAQLRKALDVLEALEK